MENNYLFITTPFKLLFFVIFEEDFSHPFIILTILEINHNDFKSDMNNYRTYFL